jgi:type III pantothenate kinase
MLLCLDIGNTHILAGVYEGEKLVLRFRHATHLMGTADQFGIFLRGILHANNIDAGDIAHAALCSVVPGVNFTLRHAISQYFKAQIFQLQGGVKTGLDIKYKNPAEIGADRIAGAIGGVKAFPKKNLIIIDMGTATTFVAVGKKGEYFGGVIQPGMRVSMESLKSNTAKLMDVDIEAQETYLGRTTREGIQKGLFFGQLGALKEIISGLKKEQFGREEATVIGTGGFAQLFRDQKIFDALLPDLVLDGIRIAHDYALEKPKKSKTA